jgi:hypothetical protein
MAANKYTIKPHDTTDKAMLVISKPRKKARVPFAQSEEADDGRQIDDVAHILSLEAARASFTTSRTARAARRIRNERPLMDEPSPLDPRAYNQQAATINSEIEPSAKSPKTVPPGAPSPAGVSGGSPTAVCVVTIPPLRHILTGIKS